MDNKKLVTWGGVNNLVKDLVFNIEGSYDLIVGLSRGGLVPAVMMSHMMDIPMTSLRWSLRDFNALDVYDLPRFATSKILFIDDLVDSGESYSLLKRETDRLGIKAKFAVLYHKECSIFKPNYAAKWDLDNRWIVFPWEK